MTTASLERILVYRPGRLGDTVVSLPALRAIRQRHPEARFSLLTNIQPRRGIVSSWDILERTRIFSEVIFYAPRASPWALIALARRLRRLRPRRLYYMTGYLRTAFQLRRDKIFFRTLCGIEDIRGMELTTQVCPRDAHGRLLRLPAESARLLRVAGALPAAAETALPVDGAEKRSVDLFWREAGLKPNDRLIALGAGSNIPATRWPVDRFQSLAQRLLLRFPESRLLVVGGEREAESAAGICRALGPRAVNCAGRLTVLESAEALRRCSLFVGNDAGAMHMAAAAKTRCVAIFSARENPGVWEPEGPRHIVLRKEVPCAGCLLTTCRDKGLLCLTEISVDEVFRACVSVLEDLPLCRT